MPTEPYKKYLMLWGDRRIAADETEAEAFHTWAENEGISHRFDVSGRDNSELWLTVYATSRAQVESCNDWMSTHRTGCYTA